MESINLTKPPLFPWRTNKVNKASQKLNMAIENNQNSYVMDVDDP